MKIKNSAPDSEIQMMKAKNSKQFFPSRFKFINAHLGIRKGEAHGLLSISGAGKSTLLKVIIADVAESAKCLVYLTEESIPKFQMKLNDLRAKNKNISYIEESDIKKSDYKSTTQFLDKLFDSIIESGVDCFFWDNLSTSKFYSTLRPEHQMEFFLRVTKFCSLNDVAFFYVTHTAKGINEGYPKLIEGEDMRGSAHPFNLSSYFYIMQNFTINNKRFSFIRRRKSRFHEVENQFYLLNYKDGSYVADEVVEFDVLNEEYFKKRNHLGKGKTK